MGMTRDTDLALARDVFTLLSHAIVAIDEAARLGDPDRVRALCASAAPLCEAGRKFGDQQ